MIKAKDSSGIRGEISWKVIDLKTNEIIRSNKNKNLIVDAYAESIASASAGAGSVRVVDEMQIGTTDTVFTASSTALTSSLATKSVSPVLSGKNVTYEATFVFLAPYTIEEMGLFDNGVGAVALTSSISEGVSTNQALAIEWTIFHNN